MPTLGQLIAQKIAAQMQQVRWLVVIGEKLGHNNVDRPAASFISRAEADKEARFQSRYSKHVWVVQFDPSEICEKNQLGIIRSYKL